MGNAVATVFKGMPKELDMAYHVEKEIDFYGVQHAYHDIADGRDIKQSGKQIFSMQDPDPIEVVTPDPVAQESSYGAMQANERSLINRKGLESTKKVNSLLNQKREALGA